MSFAGIQVDLNVVPGEEGESSLCNHNCTTEYGEYDCPAAFTKNKGLKPNYASSHDILNWIKIASKGLHQYRDFYITNILKQVCKRHNINYQEALSYLESKDITVNLFGGNPELHPELFHIIKSLRSSGYIIHLTTTGRKIMQDSFLRNLEKNPPDILALSTDDLDLEKINEFLKVPHTKLKEAWKNINPLYGQKQKSIEALYAAKVYPGEILFNIVMHPGNITEIREIIKTIHLYLPNVILNPFPFQNSFSYEKSIPNELYINRLKEIVDWIIKENPKYLTQRKHYWQALNRAYEKHGGDTQTLWSKITGTLWKCYQSVSPGYIQIGKGSPLAKGNGGKLGCYWNNETVSENSILEKPGQVFNYLLEGRYNLMKESTNPCPGCIMPRLMADPLTTWTGLDL